MDRNNLFKITLIIFVGAGACVSAHAGGFKEWAKKQVNSAKKTIKNPTRVYTKPTETVARAARDILGGEGEQLAQKVLDETKQAEARGEIIIEGTKDAFEDLDDNPGEALARIYAIQWTAGASEVVAYERREEIRKQKEAEFKQKREAARKHNREQLINEVVNQIRELEAEMEAWSASERELEYLVDLQYAIESSKKIWIREYSLIDKLATEENMVLIDEYYTEVLKVLKGGAYNPPEFSERARELGEQVLESARLANVDFHTFFTAVISKMIELGKTEKFDQGADMTYETNTNDLLESVIDQRAAVNSNHVDKVFLLRSLNPGEKHVEAREILDNFDFYLHHGLEPDIEEIQ